MIVKFNKKQIKALLSIRSRAESFFNEKQVEKPNIYREEDRDNIIRCFQQGILENIIESGEYFLED